MQRTTTVCPGPETESSAPSTREAGLIDFHDHFFGAFTRCLPARKDINGRAIRVPLGAHPNDRAVPRCKYHEVSRQRNRLPGAAFHPGFERRRHAAKIGFRLEHADERSRAAVAFGPPEGGSALAPQNVLLALRRTPSGEANASAGAPLRGVSMARVGPDAQSTVCFPLHRAPLPDFDSIVGL